MQWDYILPLFMSLWSRSSSWSRSSLLLSSTSASLSAVHTIYFQWIRRTLITTDHQIYVLLIHLFQIQSNLGTFVRGQRSMSNSWFVTSFPKEKGSIYKSTKRTIFIYNRGLYPGLNLRKCVFVSSVVHSETIFYHYLCLYGRDRRRGRGRRCCYRRRRHLCQQCIPFTFNGFVVHWSPLITKFMFYWYISSKYSPI